MAVNEELDAYLRGLYGAEPVEFAPDLTPTPMALEERPRFRSMLEGEVDPVTGETVRPSALQRIRETAEIGAAQDRREADLLAEQAGLALLEGGGVAASGERAPLPRGAVPTVPMGYLDALTEAQQQDALAASLRRLNDPAEQLARIQSRGIYQPMGLAAAPSAVSQLQQRQQAVADFLRQQREAERAPLELELLRAQAERQRRPAGGIVETEALRKLREATAEQRKAEAVKALREKPIVQKQTKTKAPETKETKPIEGVPSEYEIDIKKPPTRDQTNKFGEIVASRYELQGMTQKMRMLAREFDAIERARPGSAKTQIEQLARAIQIRAKDIAGLGALSGPDMALMESLASNPSDVKTFFVDVQSQMNGLDWWAQNAESAKAKAWGFKKAQTADGQAAPSPAAEMPAVTSALSEEKRKRLEELRRKRAEGTLGQ